MGKVKGMYANSRKILFSSFTAAALGLMGAANQKTVKAARLASNPAGALAKKRNAPKLKIINVQTKKSQPALETGLAQNHWGGGIYESHSTPAQDGIGDNRVPASDQQAENAGQARAASSDKANNLNEKQSVADDQTDQVKKRNIVRSADMLYGWNKNNLKYEPGQNPSDLGTLVITGGTIDNSSGNYNLSLADYIHNGKLDGKQNSNFDKIVIKAPLKVIGSASRLFDGLQFNQIDGLDNLDTAEVTDMSRMFAMISGPTISGPVIASLDLSHLYLKSY